ncbi:MAG: hypothetical protein ACRCXT_14575 [Paraclostridium sp.]
MMYEYKKNTQGYKEFVRVYDRNAYPTGFTIGEWKVHKNGYTQTYSKSSHNRDTVTNKVDGQWKATASIIGVPINTIADQTWTFALRIK